MKKEYLILFILFVLLILGCPIDNEQDESNSLKAPSDLKAEEVTFSQVKLTWSDNSTDESGFIIERLVSAEFGYSEIATVDSDIISFTDTGLLSNNKYTYRVCSYNSVNETKYSESIEVETINNSNSYSVSGNLYYSTTQLQEHNVVVKLDNYDSPDDLVAVCSTDSSGFYIINGLESKYYRITVYCRLTEYIQADFSNGITPEEDIVNDFYFLKPIDLSSPESESILNNTEITFQWENITEATRYSLNVINSSGNAVYFVNDLTTPTHTATIEAEDEEQYYWYVKAYDVVDNQVGDTTEEFYFSCNID